MAQFFTSALLFFPWMCYLWSFNNITYISLPCSTAVHSHILLQTKWSVKTKGLKLWWCNSLKWPVAICTGSSLTAGNMLAEMSDSQQWTASQTALSPNSSRVKSICWISQWVLVKRNFSRLQVATTDYFNFRWNCWLAFGLFNKPFRKMLITVSKVRIDSFVRTTVQMPRLLKSIHLGNWTFRHFCL